MEERETGMVRLLDDLRKMSKLREYLKRMQTFKHNPEGNPVPVKIWLSGNSNSGKSTLRENLAKLLGFDDFYVGDVFRNRARIKGVPIHEFYAEIEKEEEMAIDREWINLMLEHPRIIIEGRMAPWIDEVSKRLGLPLKDWKGTLKISLFLSVDPIEGAKRALGREENSRKTREEMIAENIGRAREEQEHYRSLYGIPHHLDTKARRGNERVFDFVIDTTNQSPEAVLNMAHKCIAHRVQYFILGRL